MSLLDNPVPVNIYDFSEPTSNDKQPLITNNLGRAALLAELVYLGGYFGEVTDQDGIANAATGRINIDSNRTIRTEQMEATDTFVVGNTIWFVAGGAGAAGVLEDANTGTDYAAGIITGFGGTAGAHTYIEFRPFAQRLDAADVSAQVIVNTAGIATNVTDIGTNVTDINTLEVSMLVEQAEPKILVYKLIADASSPLAISGLVEGDEIVDVHIICTVNNANATLILETGAADDITDAMICAVDTTLVRAGTIDDANSTLPASGAAILSVGGTAADTRAIVVITYIPVTV